MFAVRCLRITSRLRKPGLGIECLVTLAACTVTVHVVVLVTQFESLAGKVKPRQYANLSGRSSPTTRRDAESGRKFVVVLLKDGTPLSVVERLAELGWHLVVVDGRLHSQDDAGWANGRSWTFIGKKHNLSKSIESFAGLLPGGDVSLKAIGYLYAISQGADVIYDADSGSELLFDSIEAAFDLPETYGTQSIPQPRSAKQKSLVVSKRKETNKLAGFVNVFEHFGQPTLWPQGLPVKEADVFPSNYRIATASAEQSVFVRHALVDGKPDMHELLRLGLGVRATYADIAFDPSAPALLLDENVFAPFGAHDTLFMREAFWSLFIPTVAGGDIVRSYIAERLLADIGGWVAFLRPSSYRRDFYAEAFLPRGGNHSALTEFLADWEGPAGFTLSQRLRQLGADLVVKKVWSNQDQGRLLAWLGCLDDIGYSWPKVQLRRETDNAEVSFQPKSLPAPHVAPVLPSAWCQHFLLVFIFNKDFYANIPFLLEQYSTFFAKIVFYGPTASDKYGVLVIAAPIFRGYLQHRALIEAMKANPGFDGYFWLGDDVPLNVPRVFSTLNPLNMWGRTKDFKLNWPLHTAVKINKTFPGGWLWGGHNGMRMVLNMYGTIPQRFKNRMRAALGYTDVMVVASSDGGYISSRFYDDFLELISLFSDVYFETALPTTMRLMSDDVRDFSEFAGVYFWPHGGYHGQDKRPYWRVWTELMHPFKLSRPENRKAVRKWLRESRDRLEPRHLICP